MVSLLAATGVPPALDMLGDLAWHHVRGRGRPPCCSSACTQPVVLGYLLAGLIVGPHLPIPLFADPALAHKLSELGVILLMFSLGLEFSLRKLVQVGPTAGLVAVIQCSLMIWLGYVVGRAVRLDRRWRACSPGRIVAISSTTIIVKAFDEQRGGSSPSGG